jgi:hypothetical protein
MRGLRCSIGLLLAAVWFTPLRAQEPTGSISGHITDQATQLPLAGAVVRLGVRAPRLDWMVATSLRTFRPAWTRFG